MAEVLGDVGNSVSGGIDVGLDLTECNGGVCESAVAVKDRVLRVFPSLLEQAGLGLSGVLDEAISVDVAEAVDPVERGLNIWPDAFEKLDVCCALIVGGSEKDEERSGINAAVVESEGDLAKLGHLSFSGVLPDLTGL